LMPTTSSRWRFPLLLLIILPLVVVEVLVLLTTTTSSSSSVLVRAHSPLLPSRHYNNRRQKLWKSTASLPSIFRRNHHHPSSSLLLRAGDISNVINTSSSGSGLPTEGGGGGGTKTNHESSATGAAAAIIPPSPFPNNDNNNDNNIKYGQQQQQHEGVKGLTTTTTEEEEGEDDDGGEEEEAVVEVAQHVGIAKKLKNRNATNLSRKLTHAGFGIFFACLNQFVPKSQFVPCMGLLTASTLLMELLRYRRGFHWMNVILHTILGGALRKHEMEGKFTGSFYYFAGVTASAYLFPKTAGTMGICQLALADPSASYFGRRTRHIYWSRIENGLGGLGRNKGILGFVGGALFCFPFNYRVFKIAKWGGAKGVPPPGGEVALICASLLLGFAGAFADLAVPTPALTMPKKVLGVPVPPFHLDDNFVVPIFSGWACTKIFKLMGWEDGLELAEHIIF
jgi:dolichol kinase